MFLSAAISPRDDLIWSNMIRRAENLCEKKQGASEENFELETLTDMCMHMNTSHEAELQ